jgi:hypothetical protein
MTDKQREDHAQAKYWNGFITRVEAQKVFDEQLQVISRQAQAMATFDAAISCIAEKVGITPADVNAWVAQKVADAAKKTTDEQSTGSDNTQQEVSSLVTA